MHLKKQFKDSTCVKYSVKKNKKKLQRGSHRVSGRRFTPCSLLSFLCLILYKRLWAEHREVSEPQISRPGTKETSNKKRTTVFTQSTIKVWCKSLV